MSLTNTQSGKNGQSLGILQLMRMVFLILITTVKAVYHIDLAFLLSAIIRQMELMITQKGTRLLMQAVHISLNQYEVTVTSILILHSSQLIVSKENLSKPWFCNMPQMIFLKFTL